MDVRGHCGARGSRGTIAPREISRPATFHHARFVLTSDRTGAARTNESYLRSNAANSNGLEFSIPITSNRSSYFPTFLARMITPTVITLETLPTLLADDIKVKVAGIDSDGVLRGKVMAKEKFLAIAEKGFGFSSAVFGWDMHDMLWTTDAHVAPPESGYADFLAVPDLNSFRRPSWEENIPFFLVQFLGDGKSVSADGRGMLKGLVDRLATEGCHALAGGKTDHILLALCYLLTFCYLTFNM